MKKRGLVLLSVVLWSGLGFAVDTMQSEQIIQNTREFNVGAGVGFAILDGEIGWGPNIAATFESDAGSRFFMGVDIALHQWVLREPSSDPLRLLPRNLIASKTTAIQVLPTFVYRFFTPMFPAAIPYIGLSIGPNIYITEGSSHSASDPVSQTHIFAEALFRFGVHMLVTENIFIALEPKLGLLKSQFILLPQASAVWTL